MKRLGVNIDHVATVRNARGERHPDPYYAALQVVKMGADSVTIHLREDRRHINDLDAKKICKAKKVLVNLEISMNDKIVDNALKIKPNYVCLVPENRKEITTEGGLNLVKHKKKLKNIIEKFKRKKIRTSLFINPSIKDILLSKELNADCVEIHTGKISNIVKAKKKYTNELNRIKKCSILANKLNIEVHAGHGLDYKTTKILSKIKEIEECLAHSGQRPVEWLSNHVALDENYHLVHATHLTDIEIAQITGAGSNVVLCPSTEGNLGDGLFPLSKFLNKNGKWSIGTDSHVGINPLEEIRILDYGQRLITHSRNTFGTTDSGDNGQIATTSSLVNGRRAMGIDQKTFFEIGAPLDALIISDHASLIESSSKKNRTNTIIYAADSSMFYGTIVNGKWVIEDGLHHNENIDSNFIKTMNNLRVR